MRCCMKCHIFLTTFNNIVPDIPRDISGFSFTSSQPRQPYPIFQHRTRSSIPFRPPCNSIQASFCRPCSIAGTGIRHRHTETLFIIVTLLLTHVVINIHIVPPSQFSITILSPSGDHQCPIYSLFGYDTRYSPLLLSALRTMYEYPPRTNGRLLLPVPMARLYSVTLHSPPGAVSFPIM